MVHNKVTIIGSGPAAHTAAIYLARAEIKPILYEGMMANGIAAGGQLTTTTEIENFPGFPDGLTGSELMDRMREQSTKFGTEIITETVSKVDLSSKPFKLWTEFNEDAEPVTTDAIILATGASAKRMHLPGEETYWQKVFLPVPCVMVPSPFSETSHWPSLVVVTLHVKKLSS